MKRPHHAPGEEIRIVMESINTDIIPAELCRRYNQSPALFNRWREIFLECGKTGLSKPYRRNSDKKRDQEMDKSERIIGELTIANDALDFA